MTSINLKKMIGIALVCSIFIAQLSYACEVPYRTEFVRVHDAEMLYQKVVDEIERLSFNQCCSVVFDKRTNTLIVSATKNEMAYLLDFIQKNNVMPNTKNTATSNTQTKIASDTHNNGGQ